MIWFDLTIHGNIVIRFDLIWFSKILVIWFDLIWWQFSNDLIRFWFDKIIGFESDLIRFDLRVISEWFDSILIWSEFKDGIMIWVDWFDSYIKMIWVDFDSKQVIRAHHCNVV